VVRYITVLRKARNHWKNLYSLTSDTAEILLRGEVKKKKLEKTNKKKKKRKLSSKKTFGEDITKRIEAMEDNKMGQYCDISEEINRELKQEDKRIKKESSKLVLSLQKMKLKVGQRLPINSKVSQGKWFIQLVQKDLLILVLTFAGSDEVSVGRLLKKITSALSESIQELENPLKIKNDIDKVVRNYGFYNFESKNIVVPPSKVVLEETLVNREGFIKENKLHNTKTVRKIKEFANRNYQEEVNSKMIPDFSTCESPLVELIKPPVRRSQKIIEDFFKSEPIKTPKKPYKKKPRKNLNLEDISKIEIKTEDFDEKDEDIDFFNFEVIKEDQEEPQIQVDNDVKPPTSPNNLCIDLSKKFERCVFNHNIMNSASKQIKNFDSEHFTNFSSSAKKMIPRNHNFKFSAKKGPRRLSGGKKALTDITTNSELEIKEEKKVQFNSKEFWARLGLGCLLLMVFIVMLKMFLEINGNSDQVRTNSISFEKGGGSSGNSGVFL
jgi:hypothetical protein